MKLIAHRGSSEYFPENTIAAFDHALELGFNFLELDIHLTLDNVLIVMHDSEVDRTSDGSGPINQMSLQQIKNLDAGSWFEGPVVLNEIQRVPTLEEILQRYSNQAHIHIEIKSGEDILPSILHKMLLDTNWISEGVISNPSNVPGVSILSFDQDQLIRTKAVMPEVSHGLLVVEATDRDIEFCSLNGFEGLFPHVRTVSKNFIDMATDRGLYVGVWGVENKQDLEKVYSMGVHGVTVNDLIEASRILDELKS
tara:strand:+ start:5510 stop:6268 length:759 start_codon:yes stop_codon:yes gene_type:complete